MIEGNEHLAGHEGVEYQLGPEPEQDDSDPGQPAVVTWADGPLCLLLASDTKAAADLWEVAASLYAAR